MKLGRKIELMGVQQLDAMFFFSWAPRESSSGA